MRPADEGGPAALLTADTILGQIEAAVLVTDPLGNPGPERDDALLLKLEDGPQIHLRGVDQPVRGHRLLPSQPMVCGCD